MTPEQLKALLAYIDARIEMQHHDELHIYELKWEVALGALSDSRDSLARAFGINPEDLKCPLSE